jgi:hypothetical protein
VAALLFSVVIRIRDLNPYILVSAARAIKPEALEISRAAPKKKEILRSLSRLRPGTDAGQKMSIKLGPSRGGNERSHLAAEGAGPWYPPLSAAGLYMTVNRTGE